MKQTLCVIDMQPYFRSSRAIVENVVEQINRFRRMECPIILVEYNSYGPSYDEIYKALVGYNNSLLKVTKCGDDGGREIISAASEANIPINNMVVCGVNICYCVLGTAARLACCADSKIIPETKALNCSCGKTIDSCVQNMMDVIASRKERQTEGKVYESYIAYY